MGFRFRKSIKLFPGVRLNLSRGGVSASVGPRGATVNIGRRGVRATTGIPGTGLSYSTDLTGRAKAADGDDVPATTPALPPPANTWGARLIGRLLGRADRRS